MIVGLGIDTVGIPRVRQILARHGARFLERWFDPAEAAYITAHADGAERAAVRWAAKEAAAKALGTGFAAGIVPSQISVLPQSGGAPLLRLTGAAQARADVLGVTRLHVSLSHADGAAVAVVILEKP